MAWQESGNGGRRRVGLGGLLKNGFKRDFHTSGVKTGSCWGEL